MSEPELEPIGEAEGAAYNATVTTEESEETDNGVD